MNTLRHLRRVIIFAFAAIVCVVSVFVTRIFREPYREYIVPQNYVGKLIVVVDPASRDAIQNIDLLRYHYVIRFPNDGILRVNDAWGVHPMAHEEWKYPDGTLLRATKTGPYPGRVQILNGGGPHNKPGADYRWDILPVGSTASQ